MVDTNMNIQRRARVRATAQEAQLLCQCACPCAVPCLVSSCDHKHINIISLASYISMCNDNINTQVNLTFPEER